ncbi:hypothetical protein EDF56_101552 [Novosphingobium sp. PhB165]|uniref:DUF1285 domain-containing protein n=1 Tax=Novosphingobium sp. PhB165 TaxID=2485105 RepID=UPI00104D9F34|nr:DUF1285 domain-containing protein [Novosphingobium sp. PhB165]TCM21876.1 hypothetical protein EDF56_101552 [Novosphingobium sp. PhB165]
MPYDVPPDLSALTLAEAAELVAARKLPPVSEWSPAQTGDSEMRIMADGRWFHQGGEIRRPAMVRAFASLLLRDDDGRHWLVTPAEKLSIEVEDAAFIATDVRADGDALVFRLNTDDIVIAGPDHPIRSAGDPETPALYLAVRNGAEARLNRSTYGQLAEIALSGGDLSVTSRGATFDLVPS